MKKFYVGVLDAVLAMLVISMFVFIDSVIILIGFAGILWLVVEHYLIMRKCFLTQE